MHRFSILVFSIIFPILRAMSSFSTILVTILVPIVIVLLSPVPDNGLSLVKPPLNYLILYKKTLRFHILLQKKLQKEFLTFEKKIPYCFDYFLYFPIYTFSNHHHWCGYHHCIHKQKVGDSLHLYFDQALEIILPYKYATAISHTEVFDSLLKTNQELKFHFYKNFPIVDSSTHEQLSITLFCQFFIPIILEYINKVAPDELDETTIEEVFETF